MMEEKDLARDLTTVIPDCLNIPAGFQGQLTGSYTKKQRVLYIIHLPRLIFIHRSCASLNHVASDTLFRCLIWSPHTISREGDRFILVTSATENHEDITSGGPS